MVDWKIGPTFGDEIRAAGVGMDGWSFNLVSGEILYAASVSEATVDGVTAVLAAHDPARQTEPPTLPWPPVHPIPRPPIELPPPPPPVPSTRWQVPRLTIIERMMTLHRIDTLMDQLQDADRITRERWYARDQVWNDDPFAIEVVRTAGGDPAVILARP